MIITVKITYYSVVGNALVEATYDEEKELHVYDRDGVEWLGFVRGPQSMPFDRIDEAIRNGGWSAQSGTPPVCVDGRWGGRNYPKMFINVDELQRAKEELA